uniref:Uncharacterized protein n=1 Tax=Solanum tuberosum TaxID=4113 RepID=M1DWH3_SOLTU
MVSSLLVTLMWYLSVDGGMGRYPYIAQVSSQIGQSTRRSRGVNSRHAKLVGELGLSSPFGPDPRPMGQPTRRSQEPKGDSPNPLGDQVLPSPNSPSKNKVHKVLRIISTIDYHYTTQWVQIYNYSINKPSLPGHQAVARSYSSHSGFPNETTVNLSKNPYFRRKEKIIFRVIYILPRLSRPSASLPRRDAAALAASGPP